VKRVPAGGAQKGGPEQRDGEEEGQGGGLEGSPVAAGCDDPWAGAGAEGPGVGSSAAVPLRAMTVQARLIAPTTHLSQCCRCNLPGMLA
jgi:hypothetical protein